MLALGLTLLFAGATPAQAQFGKRLKDAVKRTAEDKAIQKATAEEGKAIDKAVDGAMGGGSGSGATTEPAARRRALNPPRLPRPRPRR
jgi:hypothetical protein